MVQRRGRGALECVTRAGAKCQTADHTACRRNPSQNLRRGKQTVANQMPRIVRCDLGIASRDLHTLPNHGSYRSQSTAANQVARKILASLGTQPSREQWQGRRLGLNLGWACFAVGCRRLLCLAGVLFTLLSCCVCVLFICPAHRPQVAHEKNAADSGKKTTEAAAPTSNGGLP